jgi:hypothetical protein
MSLGECAALEEAASRSAGRASHCSCSESSALMGRMSNAEDMKGWLALGRWETNACKRGL